MLTIWSTRGSNSLTSHEQIQETIKQLEKWSSNTGFDFSADKTKSMLFSRKKHPTKIPTITMKGQSLQQVDHHKFLGLTFDSKLNWRTHIRLLKIECMNRMNLMKCLSHCSWGAHESSLISIYRGLIRSKLDFGSNVYSSANKRDLRALNVVQNTALRLALGAFRTSPVESLYREANEPPLWLRREQLQATYAAKLSSDSNNLTHQLVFKPNLISSYNSNSKTPKPLSYKVLHLQGSEMMANTNQVQQTTTPPWISVLPVTDTSLSKHVRMNTSPAIIKASFHKEIQKYNYDLILYTDASKTQVGVGSAVIIEDKIIKFRHPTTASVFSAEIHGIQQAVRIIETLPGGTFVICSDSLSAVTAVNTLRTINPLIIEIHKNINKLSQEGKAVILFWVPSHCDITGNEKADRAAREAITEGELVDMQLNYDLVQHFKTEFRVKWQEHWSQQQTKLKAIEPTIHPVIFKNLSRKQQVILRRLRIGHTKLTHKHLLDKQPPPNCETCDQQLTVKHLLTECPAYMPQRIQSQLASDMQTILSAHTEANRKLLEFISAINMQDSI